MKFIIKYKGQKNLRTGRIITPHGQIETPAFIPVGTQATVKALDPLDLENIGTQALLANTYHLYLRPGLEIINKAGGVGKFMGWHKPIITDSGGYQLLSLGTGLEQGVGKIIDLFADDSREEVGLQKKQVDNKTLLNKQSFCRVDRDGAFFMSHLDGSIHRWTPEKAVNAQCVLGSDIAFALDECTSPMHDKKYTQQSMEISHDWEKRSLLQFNKLKKQKALDQRSALYGIVQGGPFKDLRIRSAKFLDNLKFDGIGIGGALISKKKLIEILSWTLPYLSAHKPRHLLGIGQIDDILNAVEMGIDTFDCADPTRIARRGTLLVYPEDGGNFNNRWRINITSSRYSTDLNPVSRKCSCYLCQNFSRAYLRHLFWARELTAYRLASLHNLKLIHDLMRQIRQAIEEDKFDKLKNYWLKA